MVRSGFFVVLIAAPWFASGLASCTPPARAPARPMAPSPGSITSETPSLRRGMNLGNALDAPSEGDWGVTLETNDFAAYKEAGFDHVRLPVRFNAHAPDSAPYAIAPAFLARVDWAVAHALANGLAVVIDFHHYDELIAQPEAHRTRFVSLWREIAQRYKAQPRAVAFELLNEPNGNLTAERWNSILADALRAVRETNPTRTVIVEGASWASAENLRDTLVVPGDDKNIVGSFHMYQPILFTHQGAPWMPPEFQTTGVVFPGPPPSPVKPLPSANGIDWVRDWFERYNREPAVNNPSSPRAIDDELDMAKAWADRHHLPVYMGEFGCSDVADAASRAAWTRQVRAAAERHGFGWAYWDDGGSFKAYDRVTRRWVAPLKSALLE